MRCVDRSVWREKVYGKFSTDELSRLIGLIYDCVLDVARWPAAIDAVRETLGFATAEISVRRLPDGAPLMAATAGIAPEWLQRFQEEGAASGVDLWGGAERIAQYPLAEPIVLSHAMSRAHIRMTPSCVPEHPCASTIWWSKAA